MQELFNLCPKIEKLLNQTWQSGWQSKNMRFVLNRTFHVQVRLFSFELLEVIKVDELLERKRESSTSDQFLRLVMDKTLTPNPWTTPKDYLNGTHLFSREGRLCFVLNQIKRC